MAFNELACREPTTNLVRLQSDHVDHSVSTKQDTTECSGNVIQNQKKQCNPTSYTGHTTRPSQTSQFSGNVVQNQKLPSSVLPQKSNSNQPIPTRITSRKQRTNGRGNKFVQNDNLTQKYGSSLNFNLNQQKSRRNNGGRGEGGHRNFKRRDKLKWLSFYH